MCSCTNISIGSYDRQTSMRDPYNARNKNDGWVCIDTCLAQEIAELWHLGVHTLECCCGHNQSDPYIMVTEESIPLMLKLTYRQHVNPHCPSSKQFFYPQSV